MKQKSIVKLFIYLGISSLLMVLGCAPKHISKPYYGQGEPSNSLGVEKELYIDTTSGDKYTKTFLGWYRVGNINRENNVQHNYQLSSETYSVSRFNGYDEFATLSLLKWAGFDCYDYSFYPFYKETADQVGKEVSCPFNADGYLDYYQQLRRFADEIGICCRQVHNSYPIENSLIMESQQKCLEVAAILGAEVAAIHPMVDKTEQENIEAIRKLLPYAEKYNIKIGIENMSKYTGSWFKIDGLWIYRPFTPCTASSPESVLRIVESLDSEYVGAVIDIGHAFLYYYEASITDYFSILSDYVIGIHLQDGDNQHDAHLVPFSKDINMQEVANALLAINYQGPLTLEAINSVKRFTVEEDLLLLNESVSRFRELLENP